jgi:hypothetical protein
MFQNTTRASRRFARLGVECLEGRTLPSAAPLAPPVLSSSVQVAHVPAATQTNAAFSMHWTVGPKAVITGSNGATGSVDFALYRDASSSAKVGGPAVTMHVGVITTTSSANNSHPDIYSHTPFTLTLKLKDAGSGATGTVTFKGFINGNLSWQHSSLTITFQNATQKLTLGGRVYTVTLPQNIHPPVPGKTPFVLNATVQVSKATGSHT